MIENTKSSFERERSLNLYRIAAYGFIGNLFFPLVCFFILWPHFKNLVIISWLMAIISFNLIRILFFRSIYFKIRQNKSVDYKNSHTIFFISVVFSAVLWSSLVYLPGADDLNTYLIDLQIIFGIATVAALATLFLSMASSLTFIAISGSVFISRLIQIDDPKFNFLSLEIFLFTGALMILAVYVYKVQVRFLNLVNENQELLESQARQQYEIKELNNNLEKRLNNERIISLGIQDALDFQSRVLENSLSGMYVLDTSGYFIQLNEIGAKILGYSKEELFGKPSWLYFENSTSSDLAKKIKQVFRKGVLIKGYETFIKRKDGNTVQILLNASPLIKGKKISGAVVIAEDNTEKNKQSTLRKLRIDTLEMVASGENLEKILFFILKGFNQLNQKFQSAFYLYDQNSENFNFPISIGVSKKIQKLLQSEKRLISNFPAYKVKLNGKPFRNENLACSDFPESYKKYLKKSNIDSSISIPIMDSQKQLSGVFEVYSSESVFPDEFDMQSVNEFAQLISLVTERKSIEHELKVKNKSLSSLYELSSAVLKEIELRKLFEKIFQVLSGIQEIESIERIKIFLPKDNHLELFYTSEKSDNDGICKSIGYGDCLCGKTFETGEVIFSANSETDPLHNKNEISLPPHSHIVIPLIGKEKISGVLCLYTEKETLNVSENKKFFFLSVGRQVGLALENASLYEELKKMSLNDPLTGLANRHRMNIVVQKLIPKVKRKSIPVALAFLDIDHFKEFNDTYGHAMGDQLLITVADIIMQTIREEDLAVRYGGEEFLIIFSDTDLSSAKKIVERIRNLMVAETNKTISAGLSLYLPELSFEQALELADQALYKAKNTGRDKIVIADSFVHK